MVLKRMGYQGKQTAHGLRGLARTALRDQGFLMSLLKLVYRIR